MRIAQLRLSAYGHFTDAALDLGEAAAVHVIFGENEAGKSTALRALASILFGYPHGVEDGFRHDAKDIALGATLLAADSRRLDFVRKRRGRVSLAHTDGTPIDEAVVAGFLGGISRDLFTKVFGLDHQRLREHAHALIEEGGALGYSLAEAASGIAGLRGVLGRIGQARAELFLPGGSKPKINQRIARRAELRKEARQRTVSVSEYQRHESARREATDAVDAAQEKVKSAEVDRHRLQRIRKTLPRRSEHGALVAKRADLGKVADLPPDAAERRAIAVTAIAAARGTIEREDAALRDLATKHEVVRLDPTVIARKVEIKTLTEQRPEIEKMQGQLPRRRGELQQHLDAGRKLLADGELSGEPGNLAAVLPSELRRRAVNALTEEGRGLIERSEMVGGQHEQAKADLAAAVVELERTPAPEERSALDLALAAANEAGDIMSAIARRNAALARSAASVRDAVVSLGVGEGQTSTLRAVMAPSTATCRRIADALRAIDDEGAAALRDAVRLRQELAAIDKQIEELRAATGFASDEDLAAARARRDEGWALVRAIHVDGRTGIEAQAATYAQGGSLPDAYARQVIAADRIADALRTHARETAEFTVARLTSEEKGLALDGAECAVAAAGDKRTALLKGWQGLWLGLAVPVQPPDEMRDWIERRDRTLAQAVEVDAEQDAIGILVDNERSIREQLAAALAAIEAPVPDGDRFDDLRWAARRAAERLNQTAALHEKAATAVALATRTCDRTAKAVAKAQGALATWHARWTEELTKAGLRQTLSLAEARTILDIFNSLALEKRSIDEWSHRVKAMEADIEQFRQGVAALKEMSGQDEGADVVATCRHLEARLVAAIAADDEDRRLGGQIELHTKSREAANGTVEANEAALTALCEQAGCGHPEELRDAIARANDAKEIDRRIGALEAAMFDDGDGLDLAALFAECEGQTGEAIAAALAATEPEIAQLTREVQDAIEQRVTRRAEFDGLLGDHQAADSSQRAAVVEAEISELARQYADLTVQEVALRRAIDVYRERNEGPLIARARSLLADLTNGAYAGIRVDLGDDDQPVIIAEHPTRGSLAIEALSDGTADALYLALRLAVVEEHNARREPIPFVADDLLLALDDTRAKAAFRTLARVAAGSQVLFFTHHAHMTDLARASVPPDLLVLHRLDPASARGGGAIAGRGASAVAAPDRP